MIFLFIIMLNVYLIFFLPSIETQRRVMNGVRVNKTYMVYFLAEDEPDWAFTCGGAIIHPKRVITTFHCILFRYRVWVISGYHRYIPKSELMVNECAKKFGKRVMSICYQKRLGKTFANVSQLREDLSTWPGTGLVILLLESRIDFHDERYLQYCSYMPTKIKMTYREQAYAPGVDAVVYGWGSLKYYRPKGSNVNLNSKYLMGTSVKMMDPDECRKIYKDMYPNENITTHRTICSRGGGNVDVDGNYLGSTWPNTNDWNDMGGPLVTWMGSREYMIGVLHTILVNEKMECVSPTQYLSLRKASMFINCSLSMKFRRSNSFCDELSFDLPNTTRDDFDWEADLASLYFDNDTAEQNNQDYWLYGDT